MRAIGRELTLLTGVEQHLSLLSKSRESEEYSAFLATIVMDKEYHLQYYNLLRLWSYSYGCIMTSYSLCLKQLDTADLSLYTFFSKQLLLFDVFRRVDVSIYQKYTTRFSSLLWNLDSRYERDPDLRILGDSFLKLPDAPLLGGEGIEDRKPRLDEEPRE